MGECHGGALLDGTGRPAGARHGRRVGHGRPGRDPGEYHRGGVCVPELGFDGVYFDGAFASIAAAYDVVLRTRQVIGDDGLLHMHLTGVPDMICPFIDCHADYLLRGEHAGLSPEYARWHVSGYNLSNSIGTFCYDRLRVSPNMIDLIFSVNARLPSWVDDGMWNGAKYHLTDPEQQLMLREYYPRLTRQPEVKAPAPPAKNKGA